MNEVFYLKCAILQHIMYGICHESRCTTAREEVHSVFPSVLKPWLLDKNRTRPCVRAAVTRPASDLIVDAGTISTCLQKRNRNGASILTPGAAIFSPEPSCSFSYCSPLQKCRLRFLSKRLTCHVQRQRTIHDMPPCLSPIELSNHGGVLGSLLPEDLTASQIAR